MNIPQMLRTRLSAVPPAGGAVPQHNIGIPIEPQQGTNWCWAAVTVSIRNFSTAPPMRQCELAQIQLGHSDCCTQPLPAACNTTGFLHIALANAGVAADNLQGALAFGDLCDRIVLDKPICCAIRWRVSNDHHFVQVDGFIANGPRGDEVIVNDPRIPGGRMAYTALVNNYQNAGDWVWTYRIL